MLGTHNKTQQYVVVGELFEIPYLLRVDKLSEEVYGSAVGYYELLKKIGPPVG